MKQTIWRHINETPHSGWFMWNVYEIPASDVEEGFSSFAKKHYLPTPDGNYIYPGITHSFNQRDMQRAMEGSDWDYDSKYAKVVVV